VPPPDLTGETWRVFANREQPIQKETPQWQPVPAQLSVELNMPRGSGHRCLVNPVAVAAVPNDWGTKLEGWDLTRKLLCSSDEWRTWTEYPQRLLLSVDGTRTVAFQSEATLRERTASGEVTLTMVLFRSDKEERFATTGAPRVIAGSSD
jgi:hypothetical protein